MTFRGVNRLINALSAKKLPQKSLFRLASEFGILYLSRHPSTPSFISFCICGQEEHRYVQDCFGIVFEEVRFHSLFSEGLGCFCCYGRHSLVWECSFARRSQTETIQPKHLHTFTTAEWNRGISLFGNVGHQWWNFSVQMVSDRGYSAHRVDSLERWHDQRHTWCSSTGNFADIQGHGFKPPNSELL